MENFLRYRLIEDVYEDEDEDDYEDEDENVLLQLFASLRPKLSPASGTQVITLTNPATAVATRPASAAVTGPAAATVSNPNASRDARMMFIRPFSGEDEDYGAFQFITLCEGVMNIYDIYGHADRISFVRSRLQPGSRACCVMQGAAFSVTIIQQDYDKFRQNFLNVFSSGATTLVVKQTMAVVESVTHNLGRKDVWEASLPANILAESCLRILHQAGWCSGAYITTDNVTKFLGLLVYMLHVQPRIRLAALSIPFHPSEHLDDFVYALDDKLREMGRAAAAVNSADSNTNFTEAASQPSDSVPVATQAAVCSYCHKAGHKESKCFRKRADSRKKTSGGECLPKFTSVPKERPSVRPKAAFTSRAKGSPTRPANHGGSGKWAAPQHTPVLRCALHGAGNHSTERCFQIKNLRKKVKQKQFT
ncbi:uncharacterized protein LOC135103061 [Scylla paramamosain]|uniref:uncharacterized protein LOC135103061 n=1 Tax=Scylla paramamosain TaxID=85552 RepID=UPI003083298E